MAVAVVGDFWEYFNDSGKLIEIECESSETGGLATDVLKYYGIPYKYSANGNLASLDIKRMDAMTILRLSLLEQSAQDGQIYEPMADTDGDIVFKAVGTYSGNITDRYYTLQTMQYREECKGVMVVGAKPRVVRKPVEFKPIWGEGNDPDVYDTSFINSACTKESFSQFATIVFNDPHLDRSSYLDGIDNLYEINEDNPNDSIIGYIYYKDLPRALITKDTVINLVNSCRIPIEIGNGTGCAEGIPCMGELQNPPTYRADSFDHADCWSGLGTVANSTKGVKVNIPDRIRFEALRETVVDKFQKVSAVYLVGYVIDHLTSGPKTDANALFRPPGPNETNIYVTVNNVSKQIIRLKEGRDYAVAYEEEDQLKTPYIVFANNARPNDTATYGTGVKYKINPANEDFFNLKGSIESEGTIFPIDFTTGVLVDQIFAVCDIDTPALEIYDPDGSNNRAKSIAENMTFYVGALMIEDKPAPVGFNGATIDMNEGKQDNDPTTAQNFSDTAYERAMDEMQGGGMTLHFSFLDGDGDYATSQQQVNRLSSALQNFMEGRGTKETVYVCGPNCEPQLGGETPDGIVNEITYSYSDSSAYTISVNVGPRLVGDLAQIDGGPYTKMSDSVSAQGTVIQDLGSHVHFKVQLDGIGERLAVNMTPHILRVGDKVSCTVHNNPIEQ